MIQWQFLAHEVIIRNLDEKGFIDGQRVSNTRVSLLFHVLFQNLLQQRKVYIATVVL